MQGKLLGVEKLEDGSGLEARIYEIGPNRFGAEYVNSAGVEVSQPSEHVRMTFEQACQEISNRLRLRG